MAIVSKESLLYGVTGVVGGMLLRSVNGQTVMSVHKPPRKKKKTSDLQQLTRTRFGDATRYAREVTRDPEKCEYYNKMAKELGLSSAYTAAIKEYMGSDIGWETGKKRASRPRFLGDQQVSSLLVEDKPVVEEMAGGGGVPGVTLCENDQYVSYTSLEKQREYEDESDKRDEYSVLIKVDTFASWAHVLELKEDDGPARTFEQNKRLPFLMEAFVSGQT